MMNCKGQFLNELTTAYGLKALQLSLIIQIRINDEMLLCPSGVLDTLKKKCSMM
jgi:hypothetical protein